MTDPSTLQQNTEAVQNETMDDSVMANGETSNADQHYPDDGQLGEGPYYDQKYTTPALNNLFKEVDIQTSSSDPSPDQACAGDVNSETATPIKPRRAPAKRARAGKKKQVEVSEQESTDQESEREAEDERDDDDDFEPEPVVVAKKTRTPKSTGKRKSATTKTPKTKTKTSKCSAKTPKTRKSTGKTKEALPHNRQRRVKFLDRCN